MPGCGPRILRMGIPLYTRFGDLAPEKFVEIFSAFTSWPEYEECAFKDAVSSMGSFEVDEAIEVD